MGGSAMPVLFLSAIGHVLHPSCPPLSPYVMFHQHTLPRTESRHVRRALKVFAEEKSITCCFPLKHTAESTARRDISFMVVNDLVFFISGMDT